MKIVGREGATLMVEHLRRGYIGADFREHIHFPGQPAPFLHIAGRTGRRDVLPACLPAEPPWQNVIEGQLIRRSAILAPKAIPQEYVEPGKCRLFALLDIAFQADDAG